MPRQIAEKPVWSACYAPHGSMYFDTRGKVRACCQNRSGYLGDVTRQSLRDIWDGAATQAMRSTLESGEFPGACSFCAWQQAEGSEGSMFAKQFDVLPVTSARPRWPTQMEFALTNTCNLRCIMCSGDYSSAIRSQREHRPPMPEVYGDRYFDELAEFLPHLTEAKFYGGEPLLGREPLRVLGMLADLADPPVVTITTNATVLGPRVDALLSRLRPNLVVSLDGATAATFEEIRPGSSFARVMENVDRFRELVGPDRLSITTCLMVQNQAEFPELLNLSSEWGVPMGINVLHHPPEHSLYQLPADELGEAVERLQRRRHEVAADRLDVFDAQLDALGNRLAIVSTSGVPVPSGDGLPLAPYLHTPHRTSRWGWLPFPEVSSPTPGAAPAFEASVGVEFFVGTDGVVTLSSGAQPSIVVLAHMAGRTIEDLQDEICNSYRPMERWHLVDPPDDSGEVHRLRPGGPDDGSLELVIAACRDADGALIGAWYRLSVSLEGQRRLGLSAA